MGGRQLQSFANTSLVMCVQGNVAAENVIGAECCIRKVKLLMISCELPKVILAMPALR